MTTDADQTDVRGLAAIINSRLAAEARVARAIAFGWFCGGTAIALCLTGLGVASTLFGYSHSVSVGPAAEQAANTLVMALNQAKLKTIVSGNMSLAPGTELRLADGQTVGLNEGAIVKLDPNSSIRVVGDLKVDMPQPSKRQLQLDTPSGSNEIPFTIYTIFRSVDHGSGQVVTGWRYDWSDTTRPKLQYCYYIQTLDKGLSAKYTLAVDGSARRPSPLAKLSFNFDGAIANCIWFSGA